jgi:hypothetical protein
MKRLLLGVILSACVLGAADKAADPSCALLPGSTLDPPGAPVRSYNADNLFEYMDGNAEGYIIYGFQTMKGVTCKKDGATFVIDVSDMGDADSAYGMFTANRDLRQPEYKIGMAGQVVPRRGIFAKGHYYMEVAANPAGDYTAQIKELFANLDKGVDGNTTLPPAMAWFPAEKQQSLRLIPESVLGLRILKRGYMGQYDYGKAFVVLDDTPETAAATMQKFKARFPEATAGKIGEESFLATDKYLGKLYVFRKGRYVAGYAISAEGMDPAPSTEALAAKVQ